ncbi:MAG: translation initiation factor eIF-2B [Natrialbaceae archaeon]|nr:translation initiation factor eIF-2B [Natrialbaceae archaeon]
MIDETAEEIREMQTHSSSVVAVNATAALEELLERSYESPDEFIRDLEHNATVLRQANPSHASLQNAIREVVQTVGESYDSVEAAKAATHEAIEAVIDRVEAAKQRSATRAVELLADGDTLLTHDFSTTVVSAIEQAAEEGMALDVLVTEARPRFIGRKMARTLADTDGVDVTLLTDAAAGTVLTDCDRVLLGMDCIVEETLYNRVGTFPIAVTADYLDVPVTVIGAGTKIITDGFVFENEYRPASEVLPEPADGFDIHNPAYDATPVALLEQRCDGRRDSSVLRGPRRSRCGRGCPRPPR